MKEFFKKLRIAAYVTALLTIALGVVLVAWPMEVTGLICRVLGALLVVMGAVYIFVVCILEAENFDINPNEHEHHLQ